MIITKINNLTRLEINDQILFIKIKVIKSNLNLVNIKCADGLLINIEFKDIVEKYGTTNPVEFIDYLILNSII